MILFITYRCGDSIKSTCWFKSSNSPGRGLQMKKNTKMIITCEAIRVALDIFKEAHKLTEYVERWEDSCSNGCDEDCSCCDCCSNCKELPYDIMVELLDYDMKHIAGNWINNSMSPSSYWYDHINCSLSRLANWYDVDLFHITWTRNESQVRDILSKTRYVRVFSRTEGETSDGEFMEVNRGIEINLYAKRYYNFVQTKYWRGRRGGVDVIYEHIM